MIDEIFVVSSELGTGTYTRLSEIFPTSIDYLQLLPVKGRLTTINYSCDIVLKYAELTGVVRQSVQAFVNAPNNVRFFSFVDEKSEKLLRARFIDQSEENYLNDSLHMYVDNAQVVLINQTVPNNLPGKVYPIEANEKTLDDLRCPFFMIQAAKNQKQTNIGGLSKLLQLKFGNKVMLNFNIDIQDHLINCFMTEGPII